uniref:Uncharacterized protein n=1 Tax=Trypanosoma congolense (strain IL3000) TaxID=1068625 RepID=G0URT8_TRYCI|nr:conserved hypothetical protein [Trypanosoma congolense IL3000]
MFRISRVPLAGGLMRKADKAVKGQKMVDYSATTSSSREKVTDSPKLSGSRKGRPPKGTLRTKSNGDDEGQDSDLPQSMGFVPVNNASIGIVGYKGRHSEEKVLQFAQRMQQRDITGEVPVASFAYEVLKAHPSVRQMGLRERMSFLCDRWERLNEKQRKAYLDDPLKGLL